MTKHKWIKEGEDIDIFVYEMGSYHNGPKCSVCGFSFCHHCNPEGYDTACPCDSLSGDDSKLDLNILALNDRLRGVIGR